MKVELTQKQGKERRNLGKMLPLLLEKVMTETEV